MFCFVLSNQRFLLILTKIKFMKIRKLLRILHRDFGYFITGITLIYAFSGIILNHTDDFNPDYRVYYQEIDLNLPKDARLDRNGVINALKGLGEDIIYKKHYKSSSGDIKVFIQNGTVVFDPETGIGYMEYLKRRQVIYQMNHLHKAVIQKSWKWVSDIMSVILIFVAISGLFILKGKNGLKGRGLWLTLAGFLIPLLFIIFYK